MQHCPVVPRFAGFPAFLVRSIFTTLSSCEGLFVDLSNPTTDIARAVPMRPVCKSLNGLITSLFVDCIYGPNLSPAHWLGPVCPRAPRQPCPSDGPTRLRRVTDDARSLSLATSVSRALGRLLRKRNGVGDRSRDVTSILDKKSPAPSRSWRRSGAFESLIRCGWFSSLQSELQTPASPWLTEAPQTTLVALVDVPQTTLNTLLDEVPQTTELPQTTDSRHRRVAVGEAHRPVLGVISGRGRQGRAYRGRCQIAVVEGGDQVQIPRANGEQVIVRWSNSISPSAGHSREWSEFRSANAGSLRAGAERRRRRAPE